MNKIKRILCPADLSLDSDKALLYSVALSREYDAQLIVCYSASKEELVAAAAISEPPVGVPPVKQMQALFEKSLVRNLKPDTLAGVDWQALVIESEDPAEAIVQTAAAQTVDLIVMRSGRRRQSEATLDSITTLVCRSATCPVLVIPRDERIY